MKQSFILLTKNNQCKVLCVFAACLFFISQIEAQSYYPAGLGNTGLKLWLTAADPTTILTSAGTQATNGSSVARWKDKSGAGSDALQATTSAQPVFNTNVTNGQGALVFQNTSQYLTGASGTYQTIVSARNILGALGSTNNSYNYHYLFSSPANTDFSIRNTGTGPGSYAISYTDGPNSNDWSYNTGSPSAQWINGTQSLTGNTTNHILVDAAANPVTANYSISSTFLSRGMYGNDPVYELIAYSTTLSTTKRHLLENYEAAEWGMSASLPGSGYTVFTPPASASFNKNLVGIGYTNSTDYFLTNPAGSTDGIGFSSTTAANGFLNTAGFIMAAHNGQANTINNNVTIPGISGSNISDWNRSWNLQKTAGNSTGQITVSFNFSDYNGSTLNTTANYSILYNATDGTFATGTNKIVSTVSSGIAGNTVSFVVNAANLPNGYYTIVYSTTSILPVHFTAFTAGTENGKSYLKWNVADEGANDIFKVQRSADGNHFTDIGTVQGNPFTNSSTDYSFTDDQPADGTNYYRIQLTEISGQIIYSSINEVKVTNSNQALLSVYPNPASAIIHINFNSINVKMQPLQLFNSTGQAVITGIIVPSSGIVDINLANLSKGIYYIRMNTNGVINTMKVIKD